MTLPRTVRSQDADMVVAELHAALARRIERLRAELHDMADRLRDLPPEEGQRLLAPRIASCERDTAAITAQYLLALASLESEAGTAPLPH